MVTHAHLGHGAPTYHLASHADHVHLVCRDCSRIAEIGPDAIRPLITALEERHGFETDVGHLTVFGRCQGSPPPLNEYIPSDGAGHSRTEEDAVSEGQRPRA